MPILPIYLILLFSSLTPFDPVAFMLTALYPPCLLVKIKQRINDVYVNFDKEISPEIGNVLTACKILINVTSFMVKKYS